MADLQKNQKRLLMTFLTDGDKKVSISVDNPRADVNEVEIKACMDSIVATNVFYPNAETLVKPVEAKIVVTDTQSYDLA